MPTQYHELVDILAHLEVYLPPSDPSLDLWRQMLEEINLKEMEVRGLSKEELDQLPPETELTEASEIVYKTFLWHVDTPKHSDEP